MIELLDYEIFRFYSDGHEVFSVTWRKLFLIIAAIAAINYKLNETSD